MKLRTGPSIPDEDTTLLAIRNLLGWDEWPSEHLRNKMLEILRYEERRHKRRRNSDRARDSLRRKRGREKDQADESDDE